MAIAKRLPPQLRDAPVTVARARDLGMTPDQLRSSQVRAPFRGVRVPAHLPDDVATTAAAAAWLVPDLVLEGVSACGYDDLPLPLAVDPLRPLVAGTSAIRCRVRGIRPTRHRLGQLAPGRVSRGLTGRRLGHRAERPATARNRCADHRRRSDEPQRRTRVAGRSAHGPRATPAPRCTSSGASGARTCAAGRRWRRMAGASSSSSPRTCTTSLHSTAESPKRCSPEVCGGRL